MSRGRMRGRLIAGLHAALLLFVAYPARAHRCTGDCDFDDQVRVSELVVGLRIALGEAPVSACPQIDADASGSASIDELMVAVNNAFDYCGHLLPPTPRR